MVSATVIFPRTFPPEETVIEASVCEPPIKYSMFSIFPLTPRPARLSKPDTSSSLIFSSAAFSRMALAKGWLDNFSKLAAICKISPVTFVTLGFPSVNVPVLSIITTWTFPTCSNVGASLIRILCLAPSPVPTATAVGVARPKASGQAMTTAEMAKDKARRSG